MMSMDNSTRYLISELRNNNSLNLATSGKNNAQVFVA